MNIVFAHGMGGFDALRAVTVQAFDIGPVAADITGRLAVRGHLVDRAAPTTLGVDRRRFRPIGRDRRSQPLEHGQGGDTPAGKRVKHGHSLLVQLGTDTDTCPNPDPDPDSGSDSDTDKDSDSDTDKDSDTDPDPNPPDTDPGPPDSDSDSDPPDSDSDPPDSDSDPGTDTNPDPDSDTDNRRQRDKYLTG